jgi:beta-glucanase (GH16 family)
MRQTGGRYAVAVAAALALVAVGWMAAPGPSSAASKRWRLVLADDFHGTRLNTARWQPYGPRWPGNGGNGLRDGSALSVRDGVLTITAQMVRGTLVSGAAASRRSITYGRVMFRARTDADPSGATSGVVLLWPSSGNWPIDGETDIYETGTEPDRGSFSSYLHYGADNQQQWIGHEADATRWHRMAMEWTPTRVRFFRDGRFAGAVRDPEAISHARQHLCLQLDAFSPSMTGTVRMQVDDVRIYALRG